MWDAEIDVLDGGRTRRHRVLREGVAPSYADVLVAWQEDADFRAWFEDLLRAAPFEAFLWETPPVTRASVERPFEFALVDSPQLAGAAPEASVFAAHFRRVGAAGVAGFDNLGGDAFLLAPCPLGEDEAYTHLAAFVRKAPEAQRAELWRELGREVQARLDERPLWVSTCGLGVYWLHVRLDAWPKYYRFAPYKNDALPG